MLFLVGASLLAKVANDDAGLQAPRGALRVFASKLAPTEKCTKSSFRRMRLYSASRQKAFS
ncbi:hypothetical protein FIV38_15750 [Pseudomonas proteolytica]|nr:hypothetical protein F4W61_29590 [Pseudomonas proteolytica]TWR80866.1 hypothetical protein FIV38_15750 [Pseudomonas proteolytica]